jgi:thiamine-phosphate pyrophosphorylase
MERSQLDYSLHLVTDRALSRSRSHLEIIRAAVAGGVSIVQLREKEATTRAFYGEGLKIRDFLREHRIPLIINDRIDLVLALDADGVHLGQDDMPVAIARRILGEKKVIGASVFTVEEARESEAAGADYLGLSPIFVTSTKPELQEQIGIGGISFFRRATRVPLVGIGSMNRSNAFEGIRAGLDGVAVVSAICSQPDPEEAARSIRAEVDRAKGNSRN